MQLLYEVEFTEPAERAYLKLFAKAQEQIKAGQSEHPAVIAFNAIENALNVTLPTNPCVPSMALAGLLASVYRLALDTVSISYVVNPGKQAVVILTISAIEQYRAVRKWLNNAIDTGEVDGLLATLGLNHPCEKVQVNPNWLH